MVYSSSVVSLFALQAVSIFGWSTRIDTDFYERDLHARLHQGMVSPALVLRTYSLPPPSPKCSASSELCIDPELPEDLRLFHESDGLCNCFALVQYGLLSSVVTSCDAKNSRSTGYLGSFSFLSFSYLCFGRFRLLLVLDVCFHSRYSASIGKESRLSSRRFGPPHEICPLSGITTNYSSKSETLGRIPSRKQQYFKGRQVPWCWRKSNLRQTATTRES